MITFVPLQIVSIQFIYFYSNKTSKYITVIHTQQILFCKLNGIYKTRLTQALCI
jgi:hypothetical protein